METRRKNPFMPGYGRFPPYLAGRDAEQELIAEQVGALADGDREAGDIVLMGPRGAGKTVILRWAALAASKAGAKKGVFSRRKTPQVVRALPGHLEREQDIAELFLISGRRDFAIDEVETGARGLRAKWRAIGHSPNRRFRQAVRQCRRRPLIVLVDEAHFLDPEPCGLLLQTAQAIRQEQGRVLLILAGTPGLREVLARARATFHERGEKISLGLLDPEAAADAVRIPMAGEGIAMREDSLGRIVADSQCYPYFLQVWGRALWAAARQEAATVVDDALVRKAMPAVSRARRGLYENRRDQWQGKDRRFLAEIARAVKTHGSFDQEALEKTVGDILSRQYRAGETGVMIEKLVATDFLWKPWGARHFIPGIPSLVSYVVAADEDSGGHCEGVREPLTAGELAW